MSTRQKILLASSVLALLGLLLLTIFGDRGLADFNLIRQEKDHLIQKSDRLARENLSMSREIDRLENDLEYIESIARQESGMIAEDEIIIQFEDKGKGETSDR